MKLLIILIFLSLFFGCSDLSKQNKIFKAIKDGKSNYCEKYLKRGWNFEIRNDKGLTPLIIAIINNDVKIVKILLINGVNPNFCDGKGGSPSIHAAIYNRDDCIEVLYDYKADLNNLPPTHCE